MYRANYASTVRIDVGWDKKCTHSLVIQTTEAVQNFCYDRGPCCDVFALGIRFKFVIILEDTKSKPAALKL